MSKKHIEGTFINLIRDINVLIMSGEQIDLQIINQKINEKVIMNYLIERYSDSNVKGLKVLKSISPIVKTEVYEINEYFYDEYIFYRSSERNFFENNGLSLLADLGLCVVIDTLL